MGNLHELQDRLASELQALRSRVAELEHAERERDQCRGDLRRAERRLRELNEGSIQGILIQRDFRILYANSAFAGMLGYGSAEELLGRDLLQELSSSMPAEQRRAFYEARLRGESVPERYEVSRARKDGSRMWMEMLVRVVEWEGAPAVQVACQDVTPYRRALEELKASEQRFRDFAEASSDWFWETDAEHRFTWTSPHVAERLGLPEDRVLGKTRRELGELDSDEEKWRRHEADLAEHRPFSRFTYSFRDAAGERHYASTSGKPVFDGEERFLGYRGTARDVTEEVQVRLDAERAHSRLRDAVESIPASFHLFDSEERFVLANSRAFEMFPEYREQYVPGRSFHDLLRFAFEHRLIRDSAGRSEERVEAWLARFRDPPEFYEYQRHDGRWIRVYDRRTSEGGRVSIRFDVTSQKEREEALRASQERFRGLIEGSNLPMLVHRDFRAQFVNQAYADLFGFKSREVVLALPDIRGTFPSEDLRRSEAMYADRMAGREAPPRFERRAIRADGSLIDVDVIATVLDWEGEPAVLATFVDITKRKQAERALRDSEGRFRGLAEGSIQAIIVHRDFKPVFANQAFLEMFGYGSVEEVMALDMRALPYFAPSERERVLGYIDARLAGKPAPNRYRFEGLRKDGTRIWAEVVASTVTWDDKLAILGTYTDITDYVMAEEARRRSEDRYRSLVDGSIQGILVHRDFVPLFANRAYANIFGYETAEDFFAVGSVERLLHPTERARVTAIKNSRMKGEPVPVQYEFQGIAKDGSFAWIDCINTVIEWDGQPAILSTQVNVTERKRAERALRDSEARFRRLIGESRQAILIHRGFRPMFANDAYVRLFGFQSQEEVLALEDIAVTASPEDVPRMKERHKSLSSGAPISHRVEREAVRRDGTRFWVDVLIAMIEWEGSPATLVTYVDITERKRAEEALRSSRELLQTVFDALPLWVSVKDRESRYLMVNRKRQLDTGLSAEQYQGMHSLDLPFATREVREETVRRDRWVMEHGQALQAEYELMLPDGRVRAHNSIKVPLRGPRSEVVGVVAVVEDVTERRMLEDQLRQAQKMEAIGQLAGGVAHDFNNLLQIISGHCQFALREIGDEPASVKQDLQEVLGATERGSHLTRQLLAFGRRQMLHRADLSVNEAVQNLAGMLKRLFEENIELVVVPGKELPPVHADWSMIEQVLMNLCLNARDAMPGGGVLTITSEGAALDRAFCEANPWAYPGHFVKITVEDTGEGIRPEHLGRVFEPFFTTKELGKGTGLGLAMAYGIVRQHNGIIRAESEPGRGARFTIYLPVSSGAEAGTGGEAVPATPGGRETILVAEDEPRVRDMAARVLRQAGYVVLTAADGEEALTALESHEGGVDLVVLDVIMPKKDGRAVLETMRARMNDVPVLFCSGYSTGGLEETPAREKNARMLQKPYKAEDLLHNVRAVLDEARRRPRKHRSPSRGLHPL